MESVRLYFDPIRHLAQWLLKQRHTKDTTTAEEQPLPPLAARYLLELFLPKQAHELLIGDLEEEFRSTVYPKYGRRLAQIWFWTQSLHIISEIRWTLYVKVISNFLRRLTRG